MWQFTQAIAGLVDGCRVLGTPVTGGNVSFYNQTGSTPILPTPVVGVLGVIEDVTRRTPVGFAVAGDGIWLLGQTRDELAGSAWAEVAHDHLGGRPPVVDLEHEQRLARVLVEASRSGLLRSAHDLADGGLAQALVESCLRRGHGVAVDLPEGLDPFVALFSESTGRVLVSLAPDAEADLAALCAEAGIPLARLGAVTGAGGPELAVRGQFTLPLDQIREAWSATLPAVLGAH
jgi:phosphoribosylformylglycinamidine synthase